MTGVCFAEDADICFLSLLEHCLQGHDFRLMSGMNCFGGLYMILPQIKQQGKLNYRRDLSTAVSLQSKNQSKIVKKLRLIFGIYQICKRYRQENINGIERF